MQGNLEFGQVVLADNLQVGFGEDEGGEKEWVLKGCVRVGFQEFIQRYLQYLGGVGAVESLLCIYFSR